MQRHPNGNDGARPERCMLVRREYGLLAPEELADDPAAAGIQGSRDSPEDNTGTGGTYGRETGTEEQNGQPTLLVCIQSEDKEEEQEPPEQQCVLNVCSH